MVTPESIRLFLKALIQLPPGQTIQFARYKIGLATGWYQHKTRKPPAVPDEQQLQAALPQPDLARIAAHLGTQGQLALVGQADLIRAGHLPVFSGFVEWDCLAPPPPQLHWTELEGRSDDLLDRDIKLIWEPARFIWAMTLGQAVALTGDEGYAASLWETLDRFEQANPAYLGWNWTSAQEAAFRLIAVAASWQWTASVVSIPPDRQTQVTRWIATHAGRISPTLAYSRAQNNNHLLSEAAGLYTAGCFLPDHPAAKAWRARGWSWFNRGLLSQIQADGTYSQHSTNYHRLMLQLALWVYALAHQQGQQFPASVLQRLGAATRWLLALTDPASGKVPNLGPNDGALFLPLAQLPFTDFRPVLNAAGKAFLGSELFPDPANAALALWLGLDEKNSAGKAAAPAALSGTAPPAALHLEHPDRPSWAYLRAARFISRPGHADQLHIDLWWRGINLALDAGTYRYNDPPPWDNALAHTAVHNTITINNRDQMTPAGRFLFLDWSQAEVEQYGWGNSSHASRIVTRQTGYRRMGLTHRRTLVARAGGIWEVQDQLLENGPRQPQLPVLTRLHWLLPDAPWQLVNPDPQAQHAIAIEVAGATITLAFSLRTLGSNGSAADCDLQIYRAGENLVGGGPPQPTWGWVAPTYNEKQAALSVSLTTRARPPVEFTTRWLLPPVGFESQ